MDEFMVSLESEKDQALAKGWLWPHTQCRDMSDFERAHFLRLWFTQLVGGAYPGIHGKLNPAVAQAFLVARSVLLPAHKALVVLPRISEARFFCQPLLSWLSLGKHGFSRADSELFTEYRMEGGAVVSAIGAEDWKSATGFRFNTLVCVGVNQSISVSLQGQLTLEPPFGDVHHPVFCNKAVVIP